MPEQRIKQQPDRQSKADNNLSQIQEDIETIKQNWESLVLISLNYHSLLFVFFRIWYT